MKTINTRILNTVVLAASKDRYRYYLNGVYIEDVEGIRYYTATDGHILITANEPIQDEPLEKPILVEFTKPFKTNLERCELVINEKFCTFLVDKPESFNLINATYPDWRRVMPKEETPDAHEFAMFDPKYLKTVESVFGSLTSCRYKMENKHAACLITRKDEPFEIVLMPLHIMENKE